MPELPEVETVARALRRVLVGKRIAGAVFIGKMRLPFDAGHAAKLLAGKKISAVRRRAKYLIVECAGGAAVLAHLGMTGSFRVEPANLPRQGHDRAAFPLSDGNELRYADPRRFGFVKPVELPVPGGDPEDLSRLGPEPLDRSFTGKILFAVSRQRRTPVKVFLMDQEVVAGVGNIYASEALHAAEIDPARIAGELSMAECARVATEVKRVLRKSIGRGGSTIKDYRRVDGNEGKFQLSLKVYGRAGLSCARCGGTVAVSRQGGRSTFYCPDCQR